MDASDLPPARPNLAERVLARVAVVCLFTMAIIVTLNVLGRWLFVRAIIPDDVFIIQELMIWVLILPLGVITAARQHISVDLFTDWASIRGKALLAVLGHLVGLFFAGFLAWAAWLGLVKAWNTGDYYAGTLDIPMWLGHSSFLVGIALFLGRLLILLHLDMRKILHR